MVSKLYQQRRLLDSNKQVPEIDTKQEYTYQTKTDDPTYAPACAKDVYDVKTEISTDMKACFLKLDERLAKLEEILSGRLPLVGRRKRIYKTTRSRRKSVQSLPQPLTSFSEIIEKSREIMNRPKDQSDDLGPVFTKETWSRSMDILIAHVKWLWNHMRIKVKTPVISDGPKGSVDIYWAPDPYGLLLNVPDDPNEPATYYGNSAENPDSNHTGGQISLTKSIDPGVLAWLAHMGEK